MSSSSVMSSLPSTTQHKAFHTKGPASGTTFPIKVKSFHKSLPQTDSGATASTSSSGNQSGKSRVPTKDSVYEKKRKAYQQTMDTLGKEIETLKAQSAELSEKLKMTLSGEEGKAERDILNDSLQKLRKKRDMMNEEKTALTGQLEGLQETVRTKEHELESAREKLPCKQIEDLNAKISELERKIEGGVSLNEEKRIVAEISKLHKSRPLFAPVSSLLSTKEQAASKMGSIRTSIKNLDSELKSIRALIKEQQDKYVELISKKTNSATLVQGIRKSLEEVRSQIDEKFKERTRAYEEFAVAKEAHSQWAADRLAKYQAMQARREVEDEVKNLEKELHDLSIVSIPPEIQSLDALESVLLGSIPQKDSASNASSSTSQSHTPRAVEAIDSTKFKVMKKVEASYFEGNRKKPSSLTQAPSNVKTTTKINTSISVSLPPWAILDLEVYGLGSVRSSEDAEYAIKRIKELKERINKTNLAADQEKKLKRVELRTQIESVKTKLVSLETEPDQTSSQ